MDQHVLRITRAELEGAEHARTHGALEGTLLVLLSDMKRRDPAPVFVRVDFVEDGGLALACRRGWLARVAWRVLAWPTTMW